MEKKIIQQQLHRINRQEQKWCQKSTRNSNMTDKLEDKIPAKVRDTLNQAFYKAFCIVFEKGSPVIEKTFQPERIHENYDIAQYAFEKTGKKKHFKTMEKQANKSFYKNMGVTAVEGTCLGLLGIGLPDIPIYTGVLLKGIYEIAMNYGFSYYSVSEKYYILTMIEAALCEPANRAQKNATVDQIAFQISKSELVDPLLDQQIKAAAKALSNAMLVMKFVQGLPIVGAVGGATNLMCYNRILSYAKLKYKKRFLLQYD